MLIKYHLNNNGWLSKQDWAALEKNGWRLGSYVTFLYAADHHVLDDEGLPRVTNRPDDPEYAFKHFNSQEEAVDEWHRIVGQDPNEKGCYCCGQPHEFSIE